MIPIVYCTDIHYGAAPVSRKDDYNKVILKKVEFCLKLAKQQAALLLIGGDLFDKPQQRFYDLIPLLLMFRKYNTVRVIVNRGNPSHDGLRENSPLTLLEHANVLETSDNRDYVDIGSLRIIFAPNSVNPMSRDVFISDHHENYLMTHHLIVNTATVYDHIIMEDFHTDCSLVFCADYHPYQGILKYNDTIFVAPGSIARRKATKDNIEKVPRCVLLTDNDIKMVDVPFEQDVWVEQVDVEKVEKTELDITAFTNELIFDDDLPSLEQAWGKFVKEHSVTEEIDTYIKSRLF